MQLVRQISASASKLPLNIALPLAGKYYISDKEKNYCEEYGASKEYTVTSAAGR